MGKCGRGLWATALTGAAMVGGCGGASSSGSASEDSGGISVTLTAGMTDGSSSGVTDSADGSSSDSSGGQCPAELVCEAACCEPGQICTDGACVVDCGDDEPCGADQVCCADGELCYAGNCVVPGGACKGLACATNTTQECEDSEICDPTLGFCVPNLADPTCAFQPEKGVFDPIPRFSWGVRQVRACSLGCQVEESCVNDVCTPNWTHHDIADDDFPEWHQVVMTPMIADLDGDCVPEIVFNSYRDSTYTTNGILRALHGDDGTTAWSMGDDAYQTDPSGHPAIGDLDLDGQPDVVSPGEGAYLVAVHGDGTPMWISENYGFGGKSGAPSIANMDGQGAPEVVFGRAVYDNTGAIAYEFATGATGTSGGFGPLSCVADLDADGRPEVIAGGTAYAFTGTVGVDFTGSVLWTASPADGYCGIADFDLDGTPEVGLVNSGHIYLLNGQTGAQLADFTVPGGGAGGPPNIADFDGDGLPELGTAAADHYVVVKYDGTSAWTQLWISDTKDGSSQRTGSSVFDFDGDGRSEVIYDDEWYLRIYPGLEPDCPGGVNCDGVMSDSEILFIDINSSRTRTENPVVADVDGDFKAELIISSNNESSQGAIGDAGIEVFEDRLDNWVATVPIWNQHTYHVTNVLADATIPDVEPDNWSTPVSAPYNSYRRNTQGELETLCAPDLAPTDLTVDTLMCPALDLSVRVLNQGCLGVGPGVNVAFYDDGALLGVVQTVGAIQAGASEKVSLSVPDAPGGPYVITAVVDDDGTGTGALNECREDNNATLPSEWCKPIG